MFKPILFFLILLSLPLTTFAEIDVNRLSAEDIQIEESILEKLAPLIKARENVGTKGLLGFEEIFRFLDEKETKFLINFLELDAKKLGINLPYYGFAAPKTKFVVLIKQMIKVNNQPKEILVQFLTPRVCNKYREMARAMKKDLGRILYVESGYRSGAYQLYLFLESLKRHDYSIKETLKFVAMPGYSEHGSPDYQAIDFISADGVNCESSPEKFENLLEYKWMQKNAAKYGFVLSYPRDNKYGMSFEPWHWRFTNMAE